MSLDCHAQCHAILDFPRVSGDEPATLWDAEAEAAFSPRERG